MALWCMFRSPLILGGDVTKLTPFENDIVTNSTLLDIDQHSSHCEEVSSDSKTIVYRSQQSSKGETYVALFNISDGAEELSLDPEKVGLHFPLKAREVWTNRELAGVVHPINLSVPAHGSALYVLTSH
jgi:hypothetical protein